MLTNRQFSFRFFFDYLKNFSKQQHSNDIGHYFCRSRYFSFYLGHGFLYKFYLGHAFLLNKTRIKHKIACWWIDNLRISIIFFIKIEEFLFLCCSSKTKLSTTREPMCVFIYVQMRPNLKPRFCIKLFETRYSYFYYILIWTYISFEVENYFNIITNMCDIDF